MHATLGPLTRVGTDSPQSDSLAGGLAVPTPRKRLLPFPMIDVGAQAESAARPPVSFETLGRCASRRCPVTGKTIGDANGLAQLEPPVASTTAATAVSASASQKKLGVILLVLLGAVVLFKVL